MNLFGYDIGWDDVKDFIGNNASDIIGGASLLYGNTVGTQSASDAADATLKAAEIAAEAARFKPYSVATGFGTSYFDPETGRATYETDPALAAIRDQYMLNASQALPTDISDPYSAGRAYQTDLMGYGGTAANVANRYATAAGNVSMPTNLQNAYANITGPSYESLTGYYGGNRPSYMNLSNAYAGVGSGPNFYNNANMFSGVRAPSYSDVSGAYRGVNAPSYANQAQGVANQYTQAGADLLGQGTASAGDLYEQIRELQRPEEERQRGAMEQGLFGSGRLGMRSAQYGGTPEQMAFEKALGESKNQAAYQAINQADQLAASQRQQAMGLSGMGLSAEQQANAMRQQGYQDTMGLRTANLSAQQAQNQNIQQRYLDQMGLLSSQMGARQDANAMLQQAYANQVQRAGLGMQARQAENLQRQQGFQDYMGLQAARMGQDQARNQMLTQQYMNSIGLADKNLAAKQAQADLYNQLQSGALSSYGQQIAAAQGFQQGGMSELDQAIARASGMFQQGFGMEQLGMLPLDYGMQMGGAEATAGANAGKLLMTGATSAADANLAAGVNNMNMFSNFGLNLLGMDNLYNQ